MKKILIALLMLGLIGTFSFAAENTSGTPTKEGAKVEKIEPVKEKKPEVKKHKEIKKHKKVKKEVKNTEPKK